MKYLKKYYTIEKNNSFQHKYIDNTFHIIHFENLINELKNIGCFKEIVDFNNYPTLNASSNSKRNYNEIYDKELKDLVFNKYKRILNYLALNINPYTFF